MYFTVNSFVESCCP